MSDINFKYVSLIDSLKQNTNLRKLIEEYESDCTDHISVLMKFFESESADDFLDILLTHNELQVRHALSKGYFEERYMRLNAAVSQLQEQRKNNNQTLIYLSLMELSQAIEGMERLTSLSLMKLEHSEQKYRLADELRQIPLKQKEASTELIKKLAQGYSLDEWENDDQENISTTDMCHIVYPKVQKLCAQLDILKYLPGFDNRGIRTPNPERLKPWIKMIAPPYASKPGRPAKK